MGSNPLQKNLLEKNYTQILKRINIAQALQSKKNKTCLIVVSKNQSIESIETLFKLGQRDFGENYVQELCKKAEKLNQKGYTGLRWHFIGHLQTKKVKALLNDVNCIHTLDSEKIVLEVHRRWSELKSNQRLPVFIEVNIDNEPTKTGVLPEQVYSLSQKIKNLNSFDFQGLMCIPKRGSSSRGSFARLLELGKTLPCPELKLSMGMSDDFEIAIQEGATHVRIGSEIFKSS